MKGAAKPVHSDATKQFIYHALQESTVCFFGGYSKTVFVYDIGNTEQRFKSPFFDPKNNARMIVCFQKNRES